ncbi:MAG: hotdog fold thioesterase [Gammaproteobacteria bacterium]
MGIWTIPTSLDALKAMGKNTMMETLGIEITAINEDFIVGTMPVDQRTRQPFGLLHGGASGVLAETLGSIGSYLVAGEDKACIGIELNCSHLIAARSGIVTGTARPIRLGRSIHVWDIHIRDDEQKLCCVSRLTVAVR